jgi:hypothetical protein
LDEVSNPVLIRDPAEPQGQATTWLIEEDSLLLCPDDLDILQRWSLAVTYFSTGGDAWFQCSANPLAMDNCGTVGSFLNDERFLSGTSECFWATILCENGRVTEIDFGKYSIWNTEEISHELP